MNYILVFIGLASPVVALLLALASYFGSDRGRTSGSSFIGYFGGWVGVVVASVIVVSMLGRPLCRILSFPDETWGWVIPLFLVPLLTSIAATTYCIFWVEGLVDAAPETPTAPVSPLTILPPAKEDIHFTDEEASLMLRWNIFFDGTQYRIGTLKFDTLAEALATATNSRKVSDEL